MGKMFDLVGTINHTFTSTEAQKQGILDWNGSIIWECPYGMTVNRFGLRLLVGISHVMLQFLPIYTVEGQDRYYIGDKNTGMAFCYDCRHPGLFVDSYQDYVLKNRDYDIAMRQIQSDKQIWSSTGSIFENIGFGMAFGQEVGAIASGIGGIIETASIYAINKNFDPKIQHQYDRLYGRTTDQITLVGDSVTNLFTQYPLYYYTLTMDEATKNRMDADIQTNGYYCDEITTNLSNKFATDIVIQADNTVVEGAIPLTAKRQIVERLMNGVEFIW